MALTGQVARMRRQYRWQAWLYDWTRGPLLLGRRRLTHALAPALAPGARVLELGCGTGHNLPALARAVGPAGQVFGLDCVPEMLVRARARCASLAQVTLLMGDCAGAGTTGAPRGPFDAIVLAYVLSLVPDWRPVLEQASARLAPGGRLAVVDFLSCSVPPFRQAFASHGVSFGPERRAGLRARAADADEVHRAYAGLWSWYLFVGAGADAGAGPGA